MQSKIHVYERGRTEQVMMLVLARNSSLSHISGVVLVQFLFKIN